MVTPSDRAFTMALSTTVISATIPANITLSASGATSLNVISIQPDCDCTFYFTNAAGTAVTGKIHLAAYEIYSFSEHGDGIVYSASGLKLVATGNASGTINGYATIHA